jgi:transposase
MVRRHEITDEQFKCIEDILPTKVGRRGPKWKAHRKYLNGIFWIVRTGAPWRDLPERYGKWRSVHSRFQRWREDGTWDKIVGRLQADLDAEGAIDWDLPKTMRLDAHEVDLEQRSTW